ncbi:hypothetical protein [Loktanella salsilacus]|uniref:hypothetical protein n=1 Tax=Loktanella salsilacus TaxID=195913 RepID=UPI003CCBFA66
MHDFCQHLDRAKVVKEEAERGGRQARPYKNLSLQAIQPAMTEVNALTDLAVSIVPQKRGKSVVGLSVSWNLKGEAGRVECDRDTVDDLRKRLDRAVDRVTALTDQRGPGPRAGKS